MLNHADPLKFKVGGSDTEKEQCSDPGGLAGGHPVSVSHLGVRLMVTEFLCVLFPTAQS